MYSNGVPVSIPPCAAAEGQSFDRRCTGPGGALGRPGAGSGVGRRAALPGRDHRLACFSGPLFTRERTWRTHSARSEKCQHPTSVGDRWRLPSIHPRLSFQQFTLACLRRMPYAAPALRSWASRRRLHRSEGHRYSITSSALASNIAGTPSPIAFAALRLITSSNLVGCSMANSPGFAPLRILST